MCFLELYGIITYNNFFFHSASSFGLTFVVYGTTVQSHSGATTPTKSRDGPRSMRREDVFGGDAEQGNRDGRAPRRKRPSIFELRASWSIAQASSFGVPKTKRGHNKTCNFAKRSQIPRRLVFHSSCCEAGNCERFLVIFPKGNFEKRSQFLHLRFAIAKCGTAAIKAVKAYLRYFFSMNHRVYDFRLLI